MALKKITKGLDVAASTADGEPETYWASILYVEDNDANWDVAKLLLSRKYKLERARNARETVSLLEEKSFDLILMDIELQGSELDGIQLTQLLRGKLVDPPIFAQEVEPLDLPVIFMTAYTSRYGERELGSYGADGVVPKPVDPELLHAAIWRMLSRQRLLALKAQERQRDAEDQLEHFRAIHEESEREVKVDRRNLEREVSMLRQVETFLQVISEEITTPLTLISNPLEELAESMPDNPLIAMANQHVRSLEELVHQVLEVQKLTFHRQKLELVGIDIARFIDNASQFFRIPCESKNVTFQLSSQGSPCSSLNDVVPMMGHPESVERLISNLLTHALDRTPRGGHILIDFSTSETRVTLSVSDSGPRFPEGYLGGLIEMMGHKSGVAARASLNLALIKNLVEAMNGHIESESDVSEKPCLKVHFPVVAELRPILDVLIVDDDENIRKLLLHRLQNSDVPMTVRAVGSVDQAFEELEIVRVRCVIADYEMEGRDGLSCLQEVASRYPESRRVLMTGHADKMLMQRAVNEAQIHHAFYKPFDHLQILQEVTELVQNSSMIDTKLRTDIVPSAGLAWGSREAVHSLEDPGLQEIDGAQESGDLILVIEDVVGLRDLIRRVLRNQGYRVITASSGYRGVELARERKPRLVVTGWDLGSISGPDVIELIKRDSDLANVPVVLLTSKSDRESWKKGVETGADAFLGKPFGRLELIATVGSLLRLKKTELEAVEQSRYLEAIFESMPDGVLILDEYSKVREVNPSMAAMLGISAEALVGVPFFDLLESYDFTRLSGLAALVGAAEPANVSFTTEAGDGIALSVSGVELLDLRGSRVGYLLTARDQRKMQQVMLAESRQLAELREARQEITRRSTELERAYEDLKLHQEQIVQTEKLASLGSMVAGVAHEINTPIGVSLTASTHILPQAEELKAQIRANTLSKTALVSFIRDSSEGLAIINSNLNRASDLIRSFKQVAVDQTKLETRTIAVHEYLQEIITSLGPELRRHQHGVHLVACDEEVHLEIDPGSFAQVITNLILNALIHAFAHTNRGMGTVTVSMETSESEITIRIRDDGSGISPDNLAKIFDPFFTTRKGQGGTGLGLHIVHNIVTTQLGGQITCKSEVDEGTEFVISLPYSV